MTAAPGPDSDVAALAMRLRSAGCVFAEEEAALLLDEAGEDPAELDRLTTARESGLPLEQVLGWAELAGVRVALEPGVFVPRRRTELMVRTAVTIARATATTAGRPAVLLDLCCGSGAVAAAVVAHLQAVGTVVETSAADLDPTAVRCATHNLPGARVLRSDLYADLPADLRGRVDVLTANVPYVPTAALALLPHEARDHEPLSALDGGSDGLDLLRRVAAGAADWLRPGGSVLVEVGERQLPAALAALADAGLAAEFRTDDDLGAQVVLGSRSRNPGPAPDGRLLG